jgi:hypothetical protein
MASQATVDLARRAKRLYEERLRAQLEVTHLNEYLAIEPESGDHFFGKTLSEAIQAARAAHPDRLAYGLRIGHNSAVNIGALEP